MCGRFWSSRQQTWQGHIHEKRLRESAEILLSSTVNADNQNTNEHFLCLSPACWCATTVLQLICWQPWDRSLLMLPAELQDSVASESSDFLAMVRENQRLNLPFAAANFGVLLNLLSSDWGCWPQKSFLLPLVSSKLHKLSWKSTWGKNKMQPTRMLIVQMSKHMDMQSRRTLFWNSLFEQSCTFFPCYHTSAP